MVTSGREDNRIFVDAKNTHVVAPVANDVRTIISGRNDGHEFGRLADVETNSFNRGERQHHPLAKWPTRS